ncbi:tail fiber protein [Gluconacetobacter sp. 1b LMG 1731]|uniref:Tail fiber protein n=1 Tax=Gluconacetobacter dulcium TaxID=2729096 RepID=A0A7W4IKD8_9PROT|nr:phage tail protein [Gluconacetobacter dulcium]MBB2164344.1 tail fiber protein [Gluconacetobacter dulcium]MBB2193586.1 tail fiber protein [Gluconacetobacter dulcium]
MAASFLANFVLETATNPGTGVITLNGAAPDRRSFAAAFPSGGSVYYFADDGTQAEWGVGTLDVSGPVTLTRATIRGTTAGGTAPLNFAGGVDVYNQVPAECLPLIGDDGLARAGDAVLADRAWVDANYPNRQWVDDNYAAAGWFPAGVTVEYPGATAPPGWLLCYGQLISRATYAALFAAIGTTYGAGDGSTTFAVPDMRGRAAFGVDNMGGMAAGLVTSDGSGIDGGQLGAVGGSQLAQSHTHELTDGGHVHPLDDPGHDHPPSSGTGFVVPQKSGGEIDAGFAGGGDDDERATARTASATTGVTIGKAATGITIGSAGDGDSQNMPPAIMLNFIIYAGAPA